MRRIEAGLALIVLLAVQGAVGGQQVAAPPPPAPAAPAQSSTADNFVYAVEGRRDPFQNQLGTGTDPRATGRGEGVAGLVLGDISVRGIMQSRGTLIAMIQGPDNKSYVIHVGDKLADGVVKSVTPQGLVVLQDINDPLATQKQREVRKLLRSLEGAKE
jgi:Tfp pilus assembly protein PilP